MQRVWQEQAHTKVWNELQRVVTSTNPKDSQEFWECVEELRRLTRLCPCDRIVKLGPGRSFDLQRFEHWLAMLDACRISSLRALFTEVARRVQKELVAAQRTQREIAPGPWMFRARVLAIPDVPSGEEEFPMDDESSVDLWRQAMQRNDWTACIRTILEHCLEREGTPSGLRLRPPWLTWTSSDMRQAFSESRTLQELATRLAECTSTVHLEAAGRRLRARLKMSRVLEVFGSSDSDTLRRAFWKFMGQVERNACGPWVQATWPTEAIREAERARSQKRVLLGWLKAPPIQQPTDKKGATSELISSCD